MGDLRPARGSPGATQEGESHMPDFNTDLAESSQAEQRRMLSAQQMARLSKSMKVTHLSRMPYTVDRKGEQGLEYPSPMPVIRTILSLVFLLLVALAAWLIHWNVIAVLFVVFPIVGLAAVHLTAQRYGRELFARADQVDLGAPTPDGQPAEATGQAETDEYAAERAYWAGTAGTDAQPEDTEAQADQSLPAEDAEQLLGPHLANDDDPLTTMLLKSLRRPAYAAALENLAKERVASLTWMRQNGGFRTVSVAAEDGARLCGHELVTASSSPKWLVFVPGYKCDWTFGMFVARRYAQEGYNLLLVDPRGQCASGGDWIGMGWLDRHDVVAWCKQIVAEYGPEVSIVLHGVGAGAAACCMASSEDDLPPQVRATVAEDCYTDAWNGIVAAAHGLSLDVHPLLDLGRLYLKSHGGYDLKQADVEAHIVHSKVPILFANASGDTLVPPYMSARMAQLAKREQPQMGHAAKSFARAAHGISSLGIPEEYFGSVFSFLDGALA